jgi:hypothetical protein
MDEGRNLGVSTPLKTQMDLINQLRQIVDKKGHCLEIGASIIPSFAYNLAEHLNMLVIANDLPEVIGKLLIVGSDDYKKDSARSTPASTFLI